MFFKISLKSEIELKIIFPQLEWKACFYLSTETCTISKGFSGIAFVDPGLFTEELGPTSMDLGSGAIDLDTRPGTQAWALGPGHGLERPVPGLSRPGLSR